MAVSCPNPLLKAAGAFITALWLAQGVPAAEDTLKEEPIVVDAASSDVDGRTNTGIFRDVVISQGDIVVEAKRARANGLNFENSRWILDGGVTIRVEHRGSLRSDEAVVDFQNNRIAMATITGSPAQFEQRGTDSDLVARGRARAIEYHVEKGVVSLSEDAWLTDGRNEISGPRLVYNIREERWQGTSEPGANERVRITIVPRSGDNPAPEEEKKPSGEP